MKLSKQKITAIAVILCLLVVGVVYGVGVKSKQDQANNNVVEQEDENQEVALSLEYNEDLTSGYKEEIVIPVKLSYLPSGVYPSASISVEFDKEKLEFTGIDKGTVQNFSKQVPAWNVDIDVSNKSGVVNAMYLDKSSGKNSYHKSGFEKGTKDTVLNLKFKLKDAAKSKDILHLNIADAVFATVNGDTNNSSLSTLKNTMKNKNLMIEVK